jgi:hypothetical protein
METYPNSETHVNIVGFQLSLLHSLLLLRLSSIELLETPWSICDLVTKVVLLLLVLILLVLQTFLLEFLLKCHWLGKLLLLLQGEEALLVLDLTSAHGYSSTTGGLLRVVLLACWCIWALGTLIIGDLLGI